MTRARKGDAPERPAPYVDHVAAAIERRTRRDVAAMRARAVPFQPTIGRKVHRRGWCSL